MLKRLLGPSSNLVPSSRGVRVPFYIGKTRAGHHLKASGATARSLQTPLAHSGSDLAEAQVWLARSQRLDLARRSLVRFSCSAPDPPVASQFQVPQSQLAPHSRLL